MSKSSTTESIHFVIIDFRLLNYGPNTSLGVSPPHPVTLPKSFPVPNGTIPIGQLSMSTLNFINKSKTHITVPSPPHTIALVFTPFLFKI